MWSDSVFQLIAFGCQHDKMCVNLLTTEEVVATFKHMTCQMCKKTNGH